MDFKIINKNDDVIFCDKDVVDVGSGGAKAMIQYGDIYRGSYVAILQNGNTERRNSISISGLIGTDYFIFGLNEDKCKDTYTEKEVMRWVKRQPYGKVITAMLTCEKIAYEKGIFEGKERQKKETREAVREALGSF